jgi:hypothetical protein
MASEFGILWKTAQNVIRWVTTAPAVGIYPCGSDAPVAKSLVHQHPSPRGRGFHKEGRSTRVGATPPSRRFSEFSQVPGLKKHPTAPTR